MQLILKHLLGASSYPLRRFSERIRGCSCLGREKRRDISNSMSQNIILSGLFLYILLNFVYYTLFGKKHFSNIYTMQKLTLPLVLSSSLQTNCPAHSEYPEGDGAFLFEIPIICCFNPVFQHIHNSQPSNIGIKSSDAGDKGIHI